MADIAFTTAAARQMRKLSPDVRAQIAAKIETFAKFGNGDVKALKSAPGFRLRSGDYRVLFVMERARMEIYAVGHRRDIYG